MRETIYFSDIPTGTPEDWPGWMVGWPRRQVGSMAS